MQEPILLTLIVPIYGRPKGTRNLIMDVTNQTLDGWELILVSDACPHFEEVIVRQDVRSSIDSAMQRGNRVVIHRFAQRQGGYGHAGFNYGIDHAKGVYLIFAGNDDRISPFHFENYLRPMALDPHLDLCFFPSLVATPSAMYVRRPELRFGGVGHSELVVRTELARRVGGHETSYGHDWTFIESMLEICKKSRIDDLGMPTYVVRHLGADGETEVY